MVTAGSAAFAEFSGPLPIGSGPARDQNDTVSRVLNDRPMPGTP